MKSFPRRWWLVAAALGLSMVASALVIALPRLEVPSPTSLPSSAATPSAPSPTSPPSPAPTPMPATLELEWAQTGAFGDERSGANDALDATRWAEGLVAVGARYLGQVPQSGILPPTRSGLIWLSADGRAWNDVTPPVEFRRIRLHQVFAAADGSLIVVGRSWGRHWFREEGPVEQFFRSVDGREWHEVHSPLPAWRYIGEIEQGPLGYVLTAHVMQVVEEEHRLSSTGTEVWFSEDGIDWQLAWSPSGDRNDPEYLRDIDAGKDGFVAVGRRGSWHSEAFTITSLDGRNWVTPAAPAHAGVWQVAAHSPGWIIIASGFESSPAVYLEAIEQPGTTIWSSLSGIAWQQIGTMDLPPTEVDGADCYDSTPFVHSTADWLVASVRLQCASGNTAIEGSKSPLLSLDGLEWQPLPIPGLSIDQTTFAPEETGLQVNIAIATETGLVLMGNSNGQAVFWLGVPR